MIDSNKIKDDPSELFTQFNPTLYFNEPKLDDSYLTSNLNWYTIIEQSVPTDQDAFWKTIVCVYRSNYIYIKLLIKTSKLNLLIYIY